MVGEAENEEHNPGALYLGEVRADESAELSAGPAEPPTASLRRRWMVMIAVFLVGAMVGGYVWLARSDMLDSTRVELIVTDVTHDGPLPDGALTSVSVVVRNIGGTDVTITSANLPGQPSSGDRAMDELAVPAGGEAVLALIGELNCGTGLPEAIEADVRTPDGRETSAQLAVPRTDLTYAGRCRSAASGDVWVELASGWSGSGAVDSVEPTEYGLAAVIPLSIRGWGVSEVEIAEVAVSAGPGLDAEPSGIVGMRETRTVADLRVEWTVADCSAAYRAEPIDITVTFADHPPATVRAPQNLQYLLVGMTDRVCGS